MCLLVLYIQIINDWNLLSYLFVIFFVSCVSAAAIMTCRYPSIDDHIQMTEELRAITYATIVVVVVFVGYRVWAFFHIQYEDGRYFWYYFPRNIAYSFLALSYGMVQIEYVRYLFRKELYQYYLRLSEATRSSNDAAAAAHLYMDGTSVRAFLWSELHNCLNISRMKKDDLNDTARLLLTRQLTFSRTFTMISKSDNSSNDNDNNGKTKSKSKRKKELSPKKKLLYLLKDDTHFRLFMKHLFKGMNECCAVLSL